MFIIPNQHITFVEIHFNFDFDSTLESNASLTFLIHEIFLIRKGE